LVNLPKYGVMIIQLAPVTGIGALKARSIVAWGNAQVPNNRGFGGLKARAKSA